MSRLSRRRVLAFAVALVAIVALVASAAPAAAVAALAFDMPRGWTPSVPSSSMRIAEFTLPRAGGDSEDASLVVYYFGGSGGTVEANLARWIGQMAQPDGSPSKAVAKTTTLDSLSGLKMTLVDVPGTYVAEVTPGSAQRVNKPGFRLRAAVVQTPDGPYYVKLVGPQATVTRWDSSFMTFLKSMRVTD
jgi:hypothetical protein